MAMFTIAARSAANERARATPCRSANALRAALLTGIAAALSACGGGGGDPAPSDTPPPGDTAPPEPPAPDDADTLAAPAVVALQAGHGKVTIEWEGVPEADGYHIYYGQDATLTPDEHAAQQGTWLQNVSSPHTIDGLVPGESYYFIVTAFTADDESLPSTTAAVTLPGPISNSATHALNDSGVVRCADATDTDVDCPQPGYPLQDAETGRDAQALAGTLPKSGAGAAGFDFTKISGAGVPLPADAALGPEPSDWACTLDHVTGLLWEVRPDAPGTLRDRTHTYSWHSPDDDTNGGHEGTEDGGTCTGSACDTSAYVSAVNAEALCGFDDWRVPSAEELASLVHHGRTGPAIGTDYFPDVPATNRLYWTATPFAADATAAWSVDFADGQLVPPQKTYLARLRLVRATD